MAALLGRPWFWIAAVAILFGVPLGRSLLRSVPPPPPPLGTVPPFALTDQAGRSFGTEQLAGKVWVANFIFTACQGSCPLLSKKMAEVQHRARHLGPDFHLVSITVDPERDNPARLAEYGARYGADPQKWSFLTGSMAAVQAAVVDGFKVGMGKTARPGAPDAAAAGAADKRAVDDDFWEIFHGENLVLVDQHLQIRGYFPATAEGLNRLLEAIGLVINSA
jgi:protein SCO1/2